MRMKVTLILVLALAFLPAAGNASAASHAGGKGPAAHLLKGHALLKESASYLGITVKQLRTQLKTGQSLAQVADATAGKSSSGLLADLVGAAKTKLDTLVTAGKLKAERETKLLDRVTKRLQHRIARVHKTKT